jgi:predicted metalloprotease with PDZ domain
MLRRHALAAALSLALSGAAFAPVTLAQATPPLSTEAYPGSIALSVDATDIAHRVFKVHEQIPVKPGTLRLYYPQWLPGNHGPRGPIDLLAGLRFEAGGKFLPWRRDPLDMYSFLVDVPEGASTLDADFDFLSPMDSAQGRVVLTPELLGIQWNTVLLYPAGYDASKITFAPSVDLPHDWNAGTALRGMAIRVPAPGAAAEPMHMSFDPVSLEVLVDSPLLAGKYSKHIELDKRPGSSVEIFAAADKPAMLELKPEVLAHHKALVAQTDKLFGARHYHDYHFLASVSDNYSGIGLEHQQSTEVGVDTDYFTDTKDEGDADLFSHEFTHSWNGKFRRGADLATPNFNVPMQDSLLWVYEGQTQYWGNVLAVRAGFRSAEQARDGLALVAAGYDHREGRAWRPLADTTNQPIISARRPQAWRSWQRAEDYYSEGELIWLDADTLIREKSGGKKSLDDFARAFFGVQDGRTEVLTYSFDDVVAALNSVLPYDWATFLRERVEQRSEHAPLDGLARGGWKLVYKDTPNAAAAAAAKKRGGGADFSYSLGLGLGKDNKIGDVMWNSVAFKAGLAPGMVLVAVNGEAASADELTDAVKAAKTSKDPIVLLVNSFGHISTVKLDYHGGLLYPHLERIPGTPDRLAQIQAPKK